MPEFKSSLELHRPMLEKIQRRLFLKQTLSIGAIAMLTGCNLDDGDSIDRALWKVANWNDEVQSRIFSSHKLAPIYNETDITNPFPFNAYYSENEAPVIKKDTFRLKVSGLVNDKTPWRLSSLRKLPQESQITKHFCVEGWSAIGKWGGIPFHRFLSQVGADTTAKYIAFYCADNYWTSIDMPTALHPQTLLVLDFPMDNTETKYGFPVKIRVPTKLGFKNPKFVMEIRVTNEYPGGYWENQGYNWFAGV